MLAALIGITAVVLAFGYNTRRVYMCINKDYGSQYIGGWAIATPMTIVALVATVVAYFSLWEDLDLDYDATAQRVVLTWLGLVFVPLLLGIVLRSVKTNRDKKRAASLYFDNEY